MKMANLIFLNIFVFMISTIVPQSAEAAMLNHLQYFVNRNRYAVHTSTFQKPFSIEKVISTSMDMALRSCQQDFKAERWNCPATDFSQRRAAKKNHFDREDAYVTAISAAAIIYTISKECSSGTYAGCGCRNGASGLPQCSDDPQHAAQIYLQFTKQKFGDDFSSRLGEHNYKAITTLLQQSMLRQCVCTSSGCSEDSCINKLKPFNEIASDIKSMYDEGLKIVNAVNSRVIWKNIDLDSLVYSLESPDYCDAHTVVDWSGMLGRQCTKKKSKNGKQFGSCEHLCHECGYEVRTENVVFERSCNCHFTWNYQIICERCVEVQQQFFCS